MKRKLVVHVGPNYLLPGTRHGIRVKEDEVHLCYEPDKSNWHFLKRKNPKARVGISGKAFEKSSLAKESVDEIHIHNVLCDPEVFFKKQILQKAAVALKPGGRIWVGHTRTPDNFSFDQFKATARKFGLNAKIVVMDETGKGEPSRKQLRLMTNRMGNIVEEGVMNNFFLAVLTKPKAKNNS